MSRGDELHKCVVLESEDEGEECVNTLQCDSCDKIFSKPWVLKRHQKEQHSGKMFSCKHCNKYETKRQENLRVHIQNMHPETAPSELPTLYKLLPFKHQVSKTNSAEWDGTKIHSMLSKASLEKLPPTVTVKQPKSKKLSPKQHRTIVDQIKSSTVTHLQKQKSASLFPLSKISQHMTSPTPCEEVMKLEIEILDKKHEQKSRRQLSSSDGDEPPKKKFIQLEVLTTENEISECDDMLDETHSSISILDVKEVPCPLRKDFFNEQRNYPTLALSKFKIDEFYAENKMVVQRRDPPSPILSFDEVNFTENIKLELESQGFEKPTAIQSALWPIALSGYDVITVAGAGSGSKLAYLLPAIVHLTHQEKVQHGEGPIVLIIASSIETVRNIQLTADSFLKHENLRCLCSTESLLLRDLLNNKYEIGCNIVIGTLSEIIEMLELKLFNLSRCSYLVVDEIDRIKPRKQLEEIFAETRKDSQVLVRCISHSQDLQHFLDKHLKDYVQVNMF